MATFDGGACPSITGGRLAYAEQMLVALRMLTYPLPQLAALGAAVTRMTAVTFDWVVNFAGVSDAPMGIHPIGWLGRSDIPMSQGVSLSECGWHFLGRNRGPLPRDTVNRALGEWGRRVNSAVWVFAAPNGRCGDVGSMQANFKVFRSMHALGGKPREVDVWTVWFSFLLSVHEHRAVAPDRVHSTNARIQGSDRLSGSGDGEWPAARISVADQMLPLRMNVFHASLMLRNIFLVAFCGTLAGGAGPLRSQWGAADMHFASPEPSGRYLIFYLAAVLLSLVLIALIWNLILRHRLKRVRVQALLRADDHQRLQAFLNSIPYPVFLCDAQGALSIFNRAYAVFGEVVPLPGKPLSDCRQKLAGELFQQYQHVMQQRESVFEDRVLWLDGRKYDVSFWCVPCSCDADVSGGFVAGWIDISLRVRLEVELRQAKDVADAANQAKSAFLAAMSHEIRSPIDVIIGALELLPKRATEKQWRDEYVEVASWAARDLLSLIDDILDLTRLESGKASFVYQPTDLRELIAEVVQSYRSRAQQKNLTFDADVAGASGDLLLLPPLRLRQVLNNLLANAIKFTQRGSVRLMVVVGQEDDGNVAVSIEISDTGIGMSPEEQVHVFEVFEQANRHIASQFGGTGLGLSICKGLVERMGGTISLQSEPGFGTTVSVRIPAVQVVHESSDTQPTLYGPDEPSISLAGKLILVVDDHPSSRLVLQRQLEFLGLDVVCAPDARQAHTVWRAGAFDLIITDCQMPQMSGCDLAMLVRSDEVHRNLPRIPIIGCTANVSSDMMTESVNSGMDRCLVKPVSLIELARCVTQLLVHAKGRDIVDHDSDGSDIARVLSESTSSQSLVNEREFLLISLDENRADLILSRQALDRGDLKSLATHVHHILSVARLLDDEAVVTACEGLQHFCYEGHLPLVADAFVTFEAVVLMLNKTIQERLEL
ncbi:ATP-binding protein [Burkholderia pyrrocinia]|uniref:histidine kinase n=1 Tax=Burkholderia pyrrocinia TaxID=60550 RepID=A0ABZ3BNL1_BURPY